MGRGCFGGAEGSSFGWSLCWVDSEDDDDDEELLGSSGVVTRISSSPSMVRDGDVGLFL